MPDHLHILAQGFAPNEQSLVSCEILSNQVFMLLVKVKALRQKKFHDRFLRSDASLESVAWHIWMNPVRKGLTSKADEFPFAARTGPTEGAARGRSKAFDAPREHIFLSAANAFPVASEKVWRS